MKSRNQKKIDWVPTLFLGITPVAAIVTSILYLWFYDLNFSLIALFVAFYSVTVLSITAGYHRLWSHRTYEGTALVKVFYALFGAATFQNSILKWSEDHRVHHRYVDKNEDPYPITKGFWYAHILWMLYKEEDIVDRAPYGRDLRKDPIVMWQDKHYLTIAILMGFALPTLLGGFFAGSYIGGFIFGGLVRIVAVHHGTFFINSLCHYWGRQGYTDKNTARDNIILAFLTFGEGYHNYHHMFAEDYRNGIRWYHWDPTKWAIQIKAKLGMVSHLRKAPESLILQKKLAMDEKKVPLQFKINIKGATENLEQLKKNVEQAHARVLEFKNELIALKSEKSEAARQQIAQIQAELKSRKEELSIAIRQWKAYTGAAYSF